MNKRHDNAERKRQAILDAAQNVFLEEGYVATNMDRIADEAHVTKQTVYRYFESKRDLFTATLRRLGVAPTSAIAAQLDNPDTEEAVRGFCVEFLRHHLSDDHIATMRLLIAEARTAPELTEIFVPIGPNDIERRLMEFLEERFDVDNTTHLIRALTGTLLTVRDDVLIGLPPPTDAEIQDHAARTTHFFLAGLASSAQRR